MEGREGIAVAGGHESGHGPFGADISMTEAQEAAKEYHHSSPSLPSTSSTPSPPPAAAGHGEEATATPLAFSLGAEKPSEAAGAGDNGMQTAGQGEQANLSSGKRRGRPRGSGRRQILASLGELYALSAGGSFTPHVIIVPTGEDVAARIMSFSHKGPRSVCILSANGSISNVTLRQPDLSGNFTYEGRFEILQLTGSFTMAEEGRRRTGGLSVSLAGPDGRVIGGVVPGMLHAASPIQLVVGSFLPNSRKQHQRRMNLQQPQQSSPAPLALPAPMANLQQQQQPSPAPLVLPAPMANLLQQQPSPAPPAPMAPPLLLTAAMPISQAAPGNGFHAPPPSAALQQAHASTAELGAAGMNLSTASFTMSGWPPSSSQSMAHGRSSGWLPSSSQSLAHGSSPDINVSLTPQE